MEKEIRMEDVIRWMKGWVPPDKWRIDGKLYRWVLVKEPSIKIDGKPAYRLLFEEVEEEEEEDKEIKDA